MSNYSIKLNLLKIDGATLQTNAQGRMAVVLPVDEADLYVNQDGTSVYLDLSMWESKNSPYGDTHSIKKSYSKAKRELLGADAIRNKPYIGNAKIIQSNNGGAAQAPMIQQAPTGYDQYGF